jgi:deoxyribodipyrimidine photo-lyase
LNPFNLQNSDAPFSRDTAVFWFRRDLRVDDNAGLYYALKENKQVLPLFIFDTEILGRLESKDDRRVEFIYQSIRLLKTQLEEAGSSLVVLMGNPAELFSAIEAKAVYTNHDYEPYARQRDTSVGNMLQSRGISFKTFKDQVILKR